MSDGTAATSGSAGDGDVDGNESSATVSAGSDESGGDESGDDEANTYGGVVGAFPYAFRASDSRLFRTYAVGGGLLAGLVVVLFALALVDLIGATAGAAGGTFTFSRAFLLVIMVLVVVPLVAPVLFVARRHRRTGSTVGYDRALAATGYLFVASLYLGLVVSAPESLADDPGGGPVGAVVGWLYSLPRAAGVGPPLLAGLLVYAVHRLLR